MESGCESSFRALLGKMLPRAPRGDSSMPPAHPRWMRRRRPTPSASIASACL